MVFMQYGGLLAVRNRRVSILQSNPLWGPRRNLAVPAGMIATALIGLKAWCVTLTFSNVRAEPILTD